MVSVANEDEFYEKYGILNNLGCGFKNLVIPFMRGYVSGVVSDMGVSGQEIGGRRICIPPISDRELLKKKVLKAVAKSRSLGADVIAISPSIGKHVFEHDPGLKVSKGIFYSPFAYIEGVKSVSALMGINFYRSNICVADASTEMGYIITEHLLNEASYLTLCTNEKGKVMEKLDRYIITSGLSPAVVSNYRKAMKDCDILIYTGGANILELTGFVSKKMLVANLSGEQIKFEKDLLCVDEVILRGEREPVITSDRLDKNIFLTSRVWEAALLTIWNADTREFSMKKSRELCNLAKKAGIKMTAVLDRGRPIDRSGIYKYI